MSRKTKSKQQRLKSRVQQMELPGEVRRPPGGDWSAMEEIARRELAANSAKILRPRRVRDRWGNLVHRDEL